VEINQCRVPDNSSPGHFSATQPCWLRNDDSVRPRRKILISTRLDTLASASAFAIAAARLRASSSAFFLAFSSSALRFSAAAFSLAAASA
jgi:hypothetical protein